MMTEAWFRAETMKFIYMVKFSVEGKDLILFTIGDIGVEEHGINDGIYW
jgi:hypothetical protein